MTAGNRKASRRIAGRVMQKAEKTSYCRVEGNRINLSQYGNVRGQSRTQAIRGWPGIRDWRWRAIRGTRDWPGYYSKIKKLSEQLSI